MNLSSLKPAKGSVKNNFRRGRGQGSGAGGTASRGHKGNKSRSGYRLKRGFEGGQMPLQRRLPKFGFKSLNRTEYRTINLFLINSLMEKHNIKEFNPSVFVEHGLASKKDNIKILAKGKLNSACTIKAHAFSKSAKNEIEAIGGKAELI
ncbi:MAG: 50S ribosomal protein L15 [Bacteroidia bacterium]|nr:50S ribosomal protein L15 [Bacteroidia bacterium]